MIGRMLGNRYEIIEKIGEGGMAIVYKARCHLLNRYVAVKVLRPEFAIDESFVKKFKREAQAAASLSHPNVVNIYDVGQEGSTYYIVMEYIEGKTLKDIIKEQKGPLPVKFAVEIARQVCKALEHAHKNGIVHQDVKPHNILIKPDGTVKVTDFGIARAASSFTMTYSNNIMGTAYYFSPEQAKGMVTDEKSDIYSLGIVLYEMVTGKVPFEGDSPISIALKHIQEDVVPPSTLNYEVPKNLEAIILKAMEKDRMKRYNSASEFLKDLDEFLKYPWKEIVVDVSDGPTQVIPKEEIKNGLKEELKTAKIEKSPKKGRGFIAAVFSLLLLALITFLIWNFFGGYLFNKTVTVPNVINKSVEEARSILESKKLVMEIVREDYNSQVEKGRIISQNPSSNMEVKQGTVVKVVVSKGVKEFTMPNVISMNYREAQIKLQDMGLKVNIIPKPDETMPVDAVVDQNPKEGVTVKEGDNVDLYVNKMSDMVSMPDLRGKNLYEASRILNGIGILIGRIDYKIDTSLEDNTIISQSIEPNKVVNKGTSVDLVVNLKSQDVKIKEILINLPQNMNTSLVEVYKIENGNRELIYSGYHSSKDSPISLKIIGKEQIKIQVYINGNLYEEKDISF